MQAEYESGATFILNVMCCSVWIDGFSYKIELMKVLMNSDDAGSGYATWSDEDYVGRISRISRRCHTMTTVRHTISKALAYYRRQWTKEFGFWVPGFCRQSVADRRSAGRWWKICAICVYVYALTCPSPEDPLKTQLLILIAHNSNFSSNSWKPQSPKLIALLQGVQGFWRL